MRSFGPRAVLSTIPILGAGLAACGGTEGTVEPPDPVATVVVVPASVALDVGGTVQLAALARTANGAPVSVPGFSWSSDRESVATVTAGGLVTAVGVGNARISAATSGRSGQAEVTVSAPEPPPPPPPPPLTISSIDPDAIQAGWGAFTLVVRGTGFRAFSRVLWGGQPLETVLVGESELRAQVTESHVAAEGTVEIKVESPGPPPAVSNGVTFTIHPKPAHSVELLIAGNAMFLGQRVRLDARALDQFGQVIPGKTITWTSSDTTIARVEGDFLVGRALGTVTLVASATPTSRGMPFSVVAPPAVDLVFDAASATVSELVVRSLEPGASLRPLVTGRSAMQAATTAGGQRVAFTALDASGNLDIWTVARDGSDLRRVTTDAAADDHPSWSPDGQQIAFRSTRAGKSDIWVVDADGSSPRNLTASQVWLPGEINTHPAWSPNGQRIVFSRGFGLGQSLFTVSPDGSNLQVLATRQGSDLLEPAWSPDGNTIAVHRYDRSTRASGIEFVSATSGQTVFLLGSVPGGSTSPAWLDSRWLAVAGSAAPAWEGQTIILVTLDANAFRVVPMGPEHGSLANPARFPR